jgi:transposase
MNNTQINLRCAINFLSNENWSISQIAKKMNCSIRTVQKWKNGDYQSFDSSRKPGSGRKRKFNEDEMKITEEILESNNLLGSRQLVEKIEQEVEKKISDRTIRRYTHILGFEWGKPRRRPLLTDEIKQSRLEWCLKHRDEDWKRYIFSDEKMFRCGLAPVGMRFRTGAKPDFQTHGRGKVFHIWSAIHLSEKFPVIEVPKKMNADKYIEILSNAFRTHFKDGMIFQQDNAPTHTSEMILEWLDDNDFDFEDFPPYSPDLNPIENLWAIVSLKVRKRNPTSVEELKSFVLEEMKKVPRKTIKKLIISMESRVAQCIERGGSYTDY